MVLQANQLKIHNLSVLFIFLFFRFCFSQLCVALCVHLWMCVWCWSVGVCFISSIINDTTTTNVVLDTNLWLNENSSSPLLLYTCVPVYIVCVGMCVRAFSYDCCFIVLCAMKNKEEENLNTIFFFIFILFKIDIELVQQEKFWTSNF